MQTKLNDPWSGDFGYVPTVERGDLHEKPGNMTPADLILQIVKTVPSNRMGESYVDYQFTVPVESSSLNKYANLMSCN